jgi:hypothetical protein
VNETIKRSLIQTTEDCWCFYDWEGVEGREKELQGVFVEGLKLEAWGMEVLQAYLQSYCSFQLLKHHKPLDFSEDFSHLRSNEN